MSERKIECKCCKEKVNFKDYTERNYCWNCEKQRDLLNDLTADHYKRIEGKDYDDRGGERS